MFLNSRQPESALLVVEPDALVRGTLCAVCRDLDLAQMAQASSVAIAEQRLTEQAFDGLLVSIDDTDSGLTLLRRLRTGAWPTRTDAPVAVMANGCDAATAHALRDLGVRRILLRPFKIRDAVHTVQRLLEDCQRDALRQP
ncbi:hypothetical protein [Hydrogenophaga sp.]|jgi:DNA-binding NarL/FixJ family response regulator|uniref:hypothetical protein n=1 Tax=Hydrogenophaga sp. TaxID=1904254 RepID=UPI00391A258B